MTKISELNKLFKTLGKDPEATGKTKSTSYRFLVKGDERFMAFMPHSNNDTINILATDSQTQPPLIITSGDRELANKEWRWARDAGYEILSQADGYERLNTELGIYGLPSVLVPRFNEDGEILTVLSLAEVDEAQDLLIIDPDRAGGLRRRLTMKTEPTPDQLQEAQDIRKLIQGQKAGKSGSYSMAGITVERLQALHEKGLMKENLYRATLKRLTGSPRLIISDDPEATFNEAYLSGNDDPDDDDGGYGPVDMADDFDGYPS